MLAILDKKSGNESALVMDGSRQLIPFSDRKWETRISEGVIIARIFSQGVRVFLPCMPGFRKVDELVCVDSMMVVQ